MAPTQDLRPDCPCDERRRIVSGPPFRQVLRECLPPLVLRPDLVAVQLDADPAHPLDEFFALRWICRGQGDPRPQIVQRAGAAQSGARLLGGALATGGSAPPRLGRPSAAGPSPLFRSRRQFPARSSGSSRRRKPARITTPEKLIHRPRSAEVVNAFAAATINPLLTKSSGRSLKNIRKRLCQEARPSSPGAGGPPTRATATSFTAPGPPARVARHGSLDRRLRRPGHANTGTNRHHRGLRRVD